MTAYYNEIDPYCVEWLRNLIREGLIADGQVDDRSISDVTPSDLKGFTQCHFFAGLGGWSGALRLAAWPDHRPVWTGSCPCQPFSLAGKQSGFADERHLWPHWHYLIQVCRPPTILGEQVASASAWLRLVRGDLEALDYAVGTIPCEAASAGADHLRDRFWFVGHSSTGLAVGSVAAEQRGTVRQERPTVAAPSDRGDPLAHAFGLPVRDEPRRRDGADGSGAGINRDDSKNGMADGHGQRQSEWTQQHGGANQPGQQAPCGDDALRCGLANASSEQVGPAGQPRQHGDVVNASSVAERESHNEGDANTDGWQARPISSGSGDHLDWVIGADGKARRVKSGIRLLAHGIPARVAKLRALGNAIDLRPAAAFIKAVM